MGTDLITISDQPGTDLGTRWSRPQLTTSLVALVNDPVLWAGDRGALPALDEDDRRAAERALEIYAQAPRGCSAETISKLVGEAAGVMAARADTDAEAQLRLTVYQQDLADLDGDILAAAFREARRTLIFFPTIAELRAIAARMPAPPRVWVAWRLRQLLAARPAPAVEPQVDAAKFAALVERLTPQLAVQTAPRMPAAEEIEAIAAELRAKYPAPAPAEEELSAAMRAEMEAEEERYQRAVRAGFELDPHEQTEAA